MVFCPQFWEGSRQSIGSTNHIGKIPTVQTNDIVVLQTNKKRKINWVLTIFKFSTYPHN